MQRLVVIVMFVEANFHGLILGIINASVCPTVPQTLPLVAKLNFRYYKRICVSHGPSNITPCGQIEF